MSEAHFACEYGSEDSDDKDTKDDANDHADVHLTELGRPCVCYPTYSTHKHWTSTIPAFYNQICQQRTLCTMCGVYNLRFLKDVIL